MGLELLILIIFLQWLLPKDLWRLGGTRLLYRHMPLILRVLRLHLNDEI